jgi:hypothetical protein
LGLVVLIGFGALFYIGTKPEFQGADQSIQSIITSQEKELESLKGEIKRRGKALDNTRALQASAKQLEAVKLENQRMAERIAKVTLDIAAANEAIATLKKDTATRVALVRSQAKGRILPQLKTLKGKVFNNVTIRKVTDLGVEIIHVDGTARIPPQELPEAIQNEFQWEQPSKAIPDDEQNPPETHEAEDQAAKDLLLEEQRKKRILDIATKEIRIDRLREDILKLDQDYKKEKFKNPGKALQIKVQLETRQREIEKLQKDVLAMREKL